MWQHLSLANLMKGAYDGQAGGNAQLGVSFSESALSGGGFLIFSFVYGDAGQWLSFGSVVGGPATNGAIVSPQDAWYMTIYWMMGAREQEKLSLGMGIMLLGVLPGGGETPIIPRTSLVKTFYVLSLFGWLREGSSLV